MEGFKTLLKVFRVHHWIKNFLLFIPLITAHKFYDLDLIFLLCLAFLSFSFCASSIYIINDILDIRNDSQHPKKKQRPFASKEISIKKGIFLASFSLIISFIFSLSLNKLFIIFLIGYFLLSSAYSFYFKKIKYLDCIILVIFYVLRLFSGGVVVNIMPSFWLVVFSIFIFFSLALAKRYTELNLHYSKSENLKISGRNYTYKDQKNLYTLGIISGYLSVLTLAFYLGSETVSRIYQTSLFIWLAIPLLFLWIRLVWIKSKNKEMDDDPVIFAIKNKWSVIIIFLFFLSFLLAKLVEL